MNSSWDQPKPPSHSSTSRGLHPTRPHDRIDQAVLDRLLRRHEPVAVYVAQDLVDVLPRMVRDDLGHPLRHVKDLACGDLDVRGRAAEATGALMDHDLRVRQ